MDTFNASAEPRPRVDVYQHSLQDGLRIRLAKVFLSEDQTEPFGNLEILELDSLPPYQAISYHWDKSVPNSKIILGQFHMPINGSAASALRWFARERPNTYVWIDQLCISQDDLEEKSRQILLMGSIFSGAEQVVAWIGEATESSDMAMRHAQDFYTAVDNEGGWASEKTKSTITELFHKMESEHAQREDMPPYAIPEWLALGDLTRRPYFERIWIVQELGLAQESIVVSGAAAIPFHHLLRVINDTASLAGRYMATLREGEERVMTMPITLVMVDRLRSAQTEPPALWSILYICRYLTATIPHDMVYALLGLLTEADRKALSPNYNEDVEEVYRQATVYVLSQGKPRALRLLQTAGIAFQPRLPQLPSWVPDFSSFGTMSRPSLGDSLVDVDLYSPTPNKQEIAFTSSNRLLTLGGRILFAVDEILPPEPQVPVNDKDEALALRQIHAVYMWLEHVAVAFRTVCPDNEDAWIDAMWRTLIADIGVWDGETTRAKGYWRPAALEVWSVFYVFSISRLTEQWGLSEEDATRLLREQQPLLDSVVHKVDLDPGVVRFSFNRSLHRHRLVFFTENGMPGLGPQLMQASDLVCLLYGAITPFLIRKTETEGEYLLVGECYVHGLMDGEGMAMGEETKITLV
jgi:hypothetical protein